MRHIVLHPSPSAATKSFKLMLMLVVAWMFGGCTMHRYHPHAATAWSTELGESMDYVRAFSSRQEECIKAIKESTPNWGAHKEALDYGDFLEEKAPRLLQIVEKELPPARRILFQKDRALVETRVKEAERENENKAMEMQGGTLARTILHNGTKIPMQIRIASLEQWIIHLPAPLQPEIRAICERTAKN